MSASSHDPSDKKIFRARSFAISPMVCPGCGVMVAEATEQCHGCAFSGQAAVDKFPFAAPAMDLFIDPNRHLSTAARARIETAFESLSERFPQVRISTCLIDLPEETNLREFGFWMFNASPVRDAREAKFRLWTILLIIDKSNGRASVTAGYSIEPFLVDEDLESLLQKERRHLSARNYEAAITGFIEGVGRMLDEGAIRARRGIRKRPSDRDWREGNF